MIIEDGKTCKRREATKKYFKWWVVDNDILDKILKKKRNDEHQVWNWDKKPKAEHAVLNSSR